MRCLTALACLILPLSVLSAPAPAPKPKLQYVAEVLTWRATNEVAFEVEQVSGLILVKAELEGHPCTLLLDTGASILSFDSGFITNALPGRKMARYAGLGPGCNLAEVPRFFTCRAFKIGGTTLGGFTVDVLSYAHVARGLGRKIDGILGANVLGHAPFVLDIARRRITWTRNGVPPSGAVAVPAKRAPDPRLLMLEAHAGGKTFFPLLDSGASSSLIGASAWPGTTGESWEIETVGAKDIHKPRKLVANTGKPTDLLFGTAVAVKDFSPRIFPDEAVRPFPRLGMNALEKLVIYVDYAKPAVALIPAATTAR